MPDFATYSHAESQSLRCESTKDGLAAELSLGDARGKLCYEAQRLSGELSGGCRLYVLLDDGVKALEEGPIDLPLPKGCGAVFCSRGFYDYVFPTEMEIDRLKAAEAGDWLELMLLRLIPRCMLSEEFSALALMV